VNPHERLHTPADFAYHENQVPAGEVDEVYHDDELPCSFNIDPELALNSLLHWLDHFVGFVNLHKGVLMLNDVFQHEHTLFGDSTVDLLFFLSTIILNRAVTLIASNTYVSWCFLLVLLSVGTKNSFVGSLIGGSFKGKEEIKDIVFVRRREAISCWCIMVVSQVQRILMLVLQHI
jgi:hypothetical protein